MTLMRVWTVPVCLAALISISLIAALVGDGVWDTIACLVLAASLVYAAVKGWRNERIARRYSA